MDQLSLLFREFIAVSKAARLLDLSEERVRQLFDSGEIPGIRDGDGRRYCHRQGVKALALRRQVHQLLTGAKKRGPKGPRRSAVAHKPKPSEVYHREFEVATA